MEVGEVWETSMDEVDYNYCMVCASRLKLTKGYRYKVSSPMSMNRKIIITRKS